MPGKPVKAQSLGSYEVLRKLGAGGMAEVFLASHHMTAEVSRTVVIKAMLAHLADDDHFVEMFMREARIAALLSHPNIVNIHDVSVIDGRPCIVMEFLRGRDLWYLLKRSADYGERVPVAAAAAMVAQAATGLDYAHHKRDDANRRLDLVHRDISPHNLFVTRDGHVRVLDFGIAKSTYQQQRTQSGVLKGKLPYMAPEQARGSEIDGRADQFALGVILWECLTGRRLFARDDPFQTMNALFHLEAPAPSSYAPDVPAALDRICLSALSKGRDHRFPTAGALAEALRAWIRTASTETEAVLIAKSLEHAIPSSEDAAFYGFDPTSTSTSVRLPTAGFDNIEDEATVQRSREGTPSHSGINPTPGAVPTQHLPEPRAASAAPRGYDAPGPTASLSTPLAAASPVGGSRSGVAPVVLAAVLGAALLVALVLGIALAVFTTGGGDASADRSPETSELEASARPPAFDRLTPIRIAFENVPPDVVIEVNGAVLETPLLQTVASDDVRAIRAMRDGREVWRYDAVFRESTDVVLPPIPEDEGGGDSHERPHERARPESTRMGNARRDPTPTPAMQTGGQMRLGTDIQLEYP